MKEGKERGGRRRVEEDKEGGKCWGEEKEEKGEKKLFLFCLSFLF